MLCGSLGKLDGIAIQGLDARLCCCESSWSKQLETKSQQWPGRKWKSTLLVLQTIDQETENGTKEEQKVDLEDLLDGLGQ